jgi:hypothetical protein
MAAPKFQSLWTPVFALLCCAQFFGSAQHALLQFSRPFRSTSLRSVLVTAKPATKKGATLPHDAKGNMLKPGENCQRCKPE